MEDVCPPFPLGNTLAISTLQVTWETSAHLPPLPGGTQKFSLSKSPTFPIEALLVCINY